MQSQQQSEQQQNTEQQPGRQAHLSRENLSTLDVLCSLNSAGILPRSV